MKNNLNKIFCAWSNMCNCDSKKYLCCNFCKNKTCNTRCKDDNTKCKYLLSKQEHELCHTYENNLLNNKNIKVKNK